MTVRYRSRGFARRYRPIAAIGAVIFTVLSSIGTAYQTARAVLSSGGTSYTVSGNVLSSGGTSYAVI